MSAFMLVPQSRIFPFTRSAADDLLRRSKKQGKIVGSFCTYIPPDAFDGFAREDGVPWVPLEEFSQQVALCGRAFLPTAPDDTRFPGPQYLAMYRHKRIEEMIRAWVIDTDAGVDVTLTPWEEGLHVSRIGGKPMLVPYEPEAPPEMWLPAPHDEAFVARAVPELGAEALQDVPQAVFSSFRSGVFAYPVRSSVHPGRLMARVVIDLKRFPDAAALPNASRLPERAGAVQLELSDDGGGDTRSFDPAIVPRMRLFLTRHCGLPPTEPCEHRVFCWQRYVPYGWTPGER